MTASCTFRIVEAPSNRLEDADVALPPGDLVYTGEMLLDAGGCPVRVFQAEAPHTDDSTLVAVPGEKTLFLGDAACDVFSTGEKDPEACRKLAAAVEASGAEVCLEGHWTPLSARETVRDLLEE